MRILLVEDDALLGDGLKVGLQQSGYAVDWVQDGHLADSALQCQAYDLLILDLGLPGLSGFEVLKQARQRNQQLPVLILTAHDHIDDRVKGLDMGADDYLIKPFDLDELCARLRALHRRATGHAMPLLHCGGISLDPAAHKVSQDGDEVKLSAREFAVLQQLLENIGRVIPKARLEDRLYGWGSEVESNSVEVFVHHLRKKLGNDLIKTIRGVGYIIEKTRC